MQTDADDRSVYVRRTGLNGHVTTVRRLTASYFSEVNTLGGEYFEDDSYGPEISDIVESDIDRLRAGTPPEPLFLGYRGGTVAGMGQLHRHDERVVAAKRVFVPKVHRGNGLGRRLTERLIEEATAEGFETLRLNVSPYHERARQLYRSLGFEETPPPEWTTVSPELHDDWLFLRLSLSE
jgi:GNAT superfamily N-acetyltransferase